MSDNNSFKCCKCDRGWNEGNTCAGKFPDDCPTENAREHNCEFCPSHRPHCPSCNKGNVQLAVECQTCEGSGWDCCTEDTDCDSIEHGNCSITERVCYPNGAFKGITSCKGKLPCPDCTNGYRPLTDDDFKEWDDFSPDTQAGMRMAEYMFDQITRGRQGNFKGSQVVLIPATN